MRSLVVEGVENAARPTYRVSHTSHNDYCCFNRESPTDSAEEAYVRICTPLVGGMSKKRCHKAERSKEGLWQLTTDGGARFLYFQDSQRRLVVVSATGKMKEKKFHTEIATADKRKIEYLQLIKEKVSK